MVERKREEGEGGERERQGGRGGVRENETAILLINRQQKLAKYCNEDLIPYQRLS